MQGRRRSIMECCRYCVLTAFLPAPRIRAPPRQHNLERKSCMSFNPGRVLLFSLLVSALAGLASADTDAAKVFHGAIYVESYNQVMLIAVDSEGAAARDGNADNIFVVATTDPFDTPISHRWSNANLTFKASGLMVTSPTDREALIVPFERPARR